MRTLTIEIPDGINEHDALDYTIKYKPYLEKIHFWGGFITTDAFITLFGLTNKQGRSLLAKLEADCWLGSFLINRHKVYYLKRKSTILLTKNPKNGDLKYPTLKKLYRILCLLNLLCKSATSMELKIVSQLGDNLYLFKNKKGKHTYVYFNVNKCITKRILQEELSVDKINSSIAENFIIVTPFFDKEKEIDPKLEAHLTAYHFYIKVYNVNLGNFFGGEPII